jgi:glycosyltransferase involved in cell wall biosynthesis
MNKLVSVIVPTYNSSSFIHECLKSIQDQTYKNIEIIVIDNFSTDKTLEITRKFTKKFFVIGPERSSQRNYGFKRSKGSYICFIDSDMILNESVISDCVALNNSYEGYKSVVIPEKSFGVGFWAKCKAHERSFYENVSWMEAARFFSRELLIETGLYDENLISGEDWDLSKRSERYTKPQRIESYIYHNEGRLSFFGNLKKKYYYGKKISQYVRKDNSNKFKQSNIFLRYMLFFKKPLLLFNYPILSISVIFNKSLEFLFGLLGLLSNFIREKK